MGEIDRALDLLLIGDRVLLLVEFLRLVFVGEFNLLCGEFRTLEFLLFALTGEFVLRFISLLGECRLLWGELVLPIGRTFTGERDLLCAL